jgi:hypothetical protein
VVVVVVVVVVMVIVMELDFRLDNFLPSTDLLSLSGVADRVRQPFCASLRLLFFF